jgi:hypothetical protein
MIAVRRSVLEKGATDNGEYFKYCSAVFGEQLNHDLCNSSLIGVWLKRFFTDIKYNAKAFGRCNSYPKIVKFESRAIIHFTTAREIFCVGCCSVIRLKLIVKKYNV